MCDTYNIHVYQVNGGMCVCLKFCTCSVFGSSMKIVMVVVMAHRKWETRHTERKKTTSVKCSHIHGDRMRCARFGRTWFRFFFCSLPVVCASHNLSDFIPHSHTHIRNGRVNRAMCDGSVVVGDWKGKCVMVSMSSVVANYDLAGQFNDFRSNRNTNAEQTITHFKNPHSIGIDSEQVAGETDFGTHIFGRHKCNVM